ncbi:FIG00870803: hypothetical protein [Richelia intracellularis HH01]|uniref:Haloacid dehalogenase-like hydrolase n=1 Tax=Richelia intracellularis HH01 TaxID=1165094 RepID=M1X2B0_9NOST|nr:HAD family hydrolase [Richelia intracellularis]CCH66510.1 FIG00870803: hypothetical protein [Richelia intracellularis HH01]HAE05749.1 HAD family hydrolase [Richelia sp.]
MLRIITDFDGPIIDVSERYYRVYLICLDRIQNPGQKVIKLNKAEFWQLKRSRVSEIQIGVISGLDALQAQNFSHMRGKLVHTQPYFHYDCLASGALDTLLKIKQVGIDLVVMTMRRVRELNYAFDQYNLGQFFRKDCCYCLSNDHVKVGDIKDKTLLMSQALKELPPACNTWMIGDTEADIVAAQTFGIKVIAVESGIRDNNQLQKEAPDSIVKDFNSALKLILEQSPL